MGIQIATVKRVVSLMDQNKNTQGEGPRDQTRASQNKSSGDNRGNMGNPERSTGRQGEKNSSGISNRGMSESDEQADLPSRGSSSDDSSDQSER
jgi:hypothetical protein